MARRSRHPGARRHLHRCERLMLRLFLFIALVLAISTAAPQASNPASAQEYSTCKTWQEVVDREDLRYAEVIRVSDPGTKEQPAYNGFWFFDGLQFDESGRYALAMRVHFQDRDVTPTDRGEIGYIDLK